MNEIQLSVPQYNHLLESLGTYSEEDIKSGRVWADSALIDEKIGLEYMDTSYCKPNPLQPESYWDNSTTVYNFRVTNPKRWCYAKLKYIKW